MKGIILAGGTGTRLHPATLSISKQLVPVYDKPMIYYPISILMLSNIRDIVIITTPEDSNSFKKLLGDGKKIGCKFTYLIQEKPQGLAQAFLIAEDFLAGEKCALILGDNLFYANGLSKLLQKVNSDNYNCTIFPYEVNNPRAYGVVEFDENRNVISIEEKPENPKSSYAVPGLYFFPDDVVEKAKLVKPSKRGELEITDLIEMYLVEKRLKAIPFNRGSAWLDTGTHDSLLDASNFVAIVEKRQGLKIACLEEIAYRMNYINKDDLIALSKDMGKSSYAEYIRKLINK